MQLPQVLEIKGMRVLTTKQLAEMYETDPKMIQYNFRYNKKKYTSGKHYIEVQGEELKKLKTRSEFHSSLKYAKSLYLWTEKGALLHAKSLNTDKAWEVYDYLVDFYFRVKENESTLTENNVERVSKKIDIRNDAKISSAIDKIKRDIICMNILLEECEKASWESKYIDKKFEVGDIAMLIMEDCNTFLGLEPKVIEEVKW